MTMSLLELLIPAKIGEKKIEKNHHGGGVKNLRPISGLSQPQNRHDIPGINQTNFRHYLRNVSGIRLISKTFQVYGQIS